MSTLARSAKSVSDWSRNELEAYNISVTTIAPDAFFGAHLKSATIDDFDSNIFSATADDRPEISDQTLEYLQYLDLASKANSGQESAINDLARETLKLCGYAERGLLLRSRYALQFMISGEKKSAQTNITLVHSTSTVLLVIQEDKTAISQRDPEAQVIAEAIAAYQHNNLKRRDCPKGPLNFMMIPCITLVGTRPTFYLVPVTTELESAVWHGEYCELQTRVWRCGISSRRLSEGMELPDFRKIAFLYFKAFKQLAKAHWTATIADLL